MKASISIYWGNILRVLRHDSHLTQQEVASVLHISRQEYSHIETGRNQPTAEMITILSNIYEIDLFRYALMSMPTDFVREQSEFKLQLTKELKPVEEIKKEPSEKRLPSRRLQYSHIHPVNIEDLRD